MNPRHIFVPLLGALLAPALVVSHPVAPRTVDPSAADSAVEELRVGRFWHATRILRAAGAANGSPSEVLLLARAEAGWHDWAAVVDLLSGAGWLDEEDRGEAWRLLGRAQEEAGRWAAAAEAYDRYLTLRKDDAPGTDDAVRARMARGLARAGRTEEAVKALDDISSVSGPVRSWTAAELAGDGAAKGDTSAVRVFLARVRDPGTVPGAWRFLADARLTSGDSVGAASAFRDAMRSLSGARRGAAMVEVGLLDGARGDTASAHGLLATALDDAPLPSATRAARGLLDLTIADEAWSGRLARILDRGGDGAAALKAYDRVVTLSTQAGESPDEATRLARARLMATVRARQDEAVREFRALSTSESERIGATSLELWAGLRSRQGRTGDVATLRRWLLERYPSSPQAIEVMWTRASAAADRGEVEGALEAFSALEAVAPTVSRAGEARMRSGQLLLGEGRAKEASEVFDAYLRDFPEGRRWEEASYWAARTHLDLGDSANARALVERIRRAEPVSYYAVMGADVVAEPYDVSVLPGDAPVEPGWLTDGLRTLDLLDAAGLGPGADAEVTRLVERARDSAAVSLRLAEALIERGRTVQGINLGWELRQRGRPWDGRLLRVVYPFPYRELVLREAAEWHLDPLLLAALIRQESAFDARIVSRAGAIGLMQVMPPTGRALAREHGIRGFSEESLTCPEVNLHLGAAFLVEMTERYHGDLPLVLSAYNAGPTRANRWSRYPEAVDLPRFIERIPFQETRGYVKSVRRNLGLYQVLYDPR